MPEYLLVAYATTAIADRVLAEKKNLSEKYQQKVDTTLQPFILLASFNAREAMEETIVRYTQRICCGQQGFKVELNNYSGFPPHKIYLRVQDPQPFRQLAKELSVVNNYIVSCACPPAQFKNNPHLTLSHTFPEALYLPAMLHYAQQSFYEAFTVSELVLLRRSHQFDAFKRIHVFRLQPPAGMQHQTNIYN